MLAQLIPVDGDLPIELVRDITLVGRKSGTCDLVIDRGSVSKMHCLIVKTDGLLFIRDLGSTNGTKVNGQRVTRGALLPGDELAFAGARFRVHLGPAAKNASIENGATEMMSSVEPLILSSMKNGSEEPQSGEPEPQEFDGGNMPLEARAIPLGDQEDSDSDVRLLPDESAV